MAIKFVDEPKKESSIRFVDDAATTPEPKVSVPEPVASAEPKDSKKYDFVQGAADVAKSTGFGALAGAFAPELVTALGAGMMAFPPTAAFGPTVMGAGRAMRGQRIASGVSGAFGGLVGETAGQAVEATGGGKAAAETARFVGGMSSPELVRQAVKPFAKAGGYGLSILANKVLPGLGTSARTLGQLLKEEGPATANLTDAQRRFVEDKLRSIRGGEQSFQPMQDIYAVLRQGAQKATSMADQAASALESEAGRIIAEAQTTAGRIPAQFETRISNLQSQFETSADNIRRAAADHASAIRAQSESAAEAIRQRAAVQGPEMQAAARLQADQIIANGRQQADGILSEASTRVGRLRSVSDRLRASVPGQQARAAQELGAVGPAAKPTDIGNQIRQQFMNKLDELKGVREKNVERLKTAAFSDAQQKELAGQRYQSTEAYSEAVRNISREIQNPETKLLNVPEGEIRQSLVKVIDQLQSGQMSFQGLETLRRSLRDRAFGLPAEGYDAIGQQQAGRLADYVEGIQKEFSPGFEKYLRQYSEDSKPLNEFKNRLGKAIVGKEEFDMSMFKTDPAALGKQAFSTASTVDQLVKTVGPQQAERLARMFVADGLRGGSAKDVADTIKANRDWLDQFPQLAQQLNQTAERLGVTERIISKRGALSKALRTEMGAIPGKAQRLAVREEESAATAARRLEEDAASKAADIAKAADTKAARALIEGETKAAARLAGAEQQVTGPAAKAVERQREALQKEAEQRAKGIVGQAETQTAPLTAQAQKLRKEAQDKANIILGRETDEKRVMNFLLGAKADEWDAISPIIAAAPGGKERLADAVAQTIALRANASLKGAITDMQLMSENLVRNNLMSRADADQLVQKLQDVFVAPISSIQKSTLSQRLIRNAVIGYAAPGAERVVEGVVNFFGEQ
jgi:hypothetical protein